jgi:hypothetical protein
MQIDEALYLDLYGRRAAKSAKRSRRRGPTVACAFFAAVITNAPICASHSPQNA